MADDPWSVCPGCGVSLPGPSALHDRSNASEACWQLYGEVAGFELAHLTRLGRFHQLMVDTYGAQHAGGPAAPIGVAFALIGLRLALDEGWHGDEVRSAHQYLAQTWREWPLFVPPTDEGALTLQDIALAGSPDAHARLMVEWATDVWYSWAASVSQVVELIGARFPPAVQNRIRASR
jgi:Family of unknown function (DUF5946)